jgi:deazaflavin-dependent oxidoreductase (nitroreductase family)
MSLPKGLRNFNKHILNRATLKVSGASHSPISTVRHTGRQSGKPYQTPIIVGRDGAGFVFALTYGVEVDWYRNVMAAGSCTLIWRGKKYSLENPEPVAVETALPAFALPLRLILRMMGIQNFFRMECSEDQAFRQP